ncbi:MAG: PQQ-binding-like beta-propeller repeat protein [candidate division KSB1 bacterium]|nr:PQQ-binding-like beta-propeller repeat protein [candidate division KSB1 bacterium]
MFKKSYLSLLILILLLFDCSRDKKPLEPEQPSPIPCTMPQTDIPWPSLANSPWPMSTVNPQGIARSRYLGPQEGKVHWAIAPEDTFSTRDEIGPAIGPDTTIYFTIDGITKSFLALTPEGHIKWFKERSETFRIYTGPVVAADSTIYVGGANFYALRPNGSVKWVFQEGTFFVEIRPLLGIDGTIYTQNFQGIIYALTPDGNIKWQNEIGQGGTCYMSASPDGSTIYAPGKDSTLIALDAENGAILWSVKTRVNSCAGPTVDSQGNIYCYAWENPRVVHDGFICYEGFVYSLDPAGKLRWKYKVGPVGTVLPWAGITIDYNGNCYFSWNSGGIGVISLDYAGHLRWKLDYPDGFSDWPVVCDSENDLYLLNELLPKVLCYFPDGTLKFSLEVPGWHLNAAAIGHNSIMYFGEDTHWLVAVK